MSKRTEKQRSDLTVRMKINELRHCPFCKCDLSKGKPIYWCNKMPDGPDGFYPRSLSIKWLYSFNYCSSDDMAHCLILGNGGSPQSWLEMMRIEKGKGK